MQMCIVVHQECWEFRIVKQCNYLDNRTEICIIALHNLRVSLLGPYTCTARILPYPAVPCHMLPHSAVSCCILLYPAESCRNLPYPAVSCRIWRILTYPAVSCRILPYLPYPSVSCFPCRILPYASNPSPNPNHNPNPNPNPNRNPNLEFQSLLEPSDTIGKGVINLFDTAITVGF